MKIDCEGSGWALLTLGSQEIRRAGEYAIEIHGPEPLLLENWKNADFALGEFRVVILFQWSIWHFKLL